jgi:hypothetical protein
MLYSRHNHLIFHTFTNPKEAQMPSNTIDNSFIVGAVIRAMIDVLGILAHQIKREDNGQESLINVSDQPYISIEFHTNGTVIIDSLLLDNVHGMLQMHQLLNDQFKKHGIYFVLASKPKTRS